MKIWITIFALCNVSVAFGANLFFSPALSYRSQEVTSGGSTTEVTTTLIDAKLGGLFSGGSVFVGGIYHSITASSGSSDSVYTGMGASLGYLGSAWMATASYLISTSYDSGSTNYTGTGLQFDLAYHFKLSDFLLGPMLSYKSYSFDKSEIFS